MREDVEHLRRPAAPLSLLSNVAGLTAAVVSAWQAEKHAAALRRVCPKRRAVGVSPSDPTVRFFDIV